jgi:predicted Zn-dependent protease
MMSPLFPQSTWLRRLHATVLLTATLLSAACLIRSTKDNGRSRLMSEEDEIAWGRVADQDVRDALRLYEEAPELSALVRTIGEEIAGRTARPNLPWTFGVLDDPAVNAFALPGGHVYVTRGLLAHLESQDELAAVLGHEAGHVEARHAVIEMRNAQKAQLRVQFVASVADPARQHVAAVAARSARLTMLSYGREGELQADALGLGYLEETNHAPAAFLTVFDLLAKVDIDSGRVPAWLSTHPEAELRKQTLADRLGVDSRTGTGETIAVDPEYVDLLVGMVYGVDPREGQLDGTTYRHGRVGFRAELPAGWALEQDFDGVTALAPDNLSQLAVAPKFYTYQTAEDATTAFFISGTFLRHGTATVDVAGSSMMLTKFSMPTQLGDWMGLVGFIDFRGHVIALMASAPATIWPQHAETVTAAFSSVRPLSEAERAALEPSRIEVVRLPKRTTMQEVSRARQSPVSLDALLVLNRVEAEQELEANRPLKIVVGPS